MACPKEWYNFSLSGWVPQNATALHYRYVLTPLTASSRLWESRVSLRNGGHYQIEPRTAELLFYLLYKGKARDSSQRKICSLNRPCKFSWSRPSKQLGVKNISICASVCLLKDIDLDLGKPLRNFEEIDCNGSL